VRLIDSHCHLQADPFADDVDAVIDAAQAAGVERILVPGWDEPSSVAALALAARRRGLDAAAGIHPHDAAKADPAAWQGIVRLAHDHRVRAVGETGLDYDRMFSPVAAQRENLRRHLELGLELDKPVILHVRSESGSTAAHDDLIAELDRAGMRPRTPSAAAPAERPPALIHSFSGSLAFAIEVLARGLAISISGLAFRAGEAPTFGEVAQAVPDHRLLVETDSPFLAPPGAPRRRNAPQWVRVTGERVAEAREVGPGVLGEQLVAAYERVFGEAVDAPGLTGPNDGSYTR
jgi:TatD DNase family protein